MRLTCISTILAVLPATAQVTDTTAVLSLQLSSKANVTAYIGRTDASMIPMPGSSASLSASVPLVSSKPPSKS